MWDYHQFWSIKLCTYHEYWKELKQSFVFTFNKKRYCHPSVMIKAFFILFYPRPCTYTTTTSYIAVNKEHGSDELLGQRHWIVNSVENFFSMKEIQLSAMAGNQYTHNKHQERSNLWCRVAVNGSTRGNLRNAMHLFDFASWRIFRIPDWTEIFKSFYPL